MTKRLLRAFALAGAALLVAAALVALIVLTDPERGAQRRTEGETGTEKSQITEPKGEEPKFEKLTIFAVTNKAARDFGTVRIFGHFADAPANGLFIERFHAAADAIISADGPQNFEMRRDQDGRLLIAEFLPTKIGDTDGNVTAIPVRLPKLCAVSREPDGRLKATLEIDLEPARVAPLLESIERMEKPSVSRWSWTVERADKGVQLYRFVPKRD